MPLGCPGWFLGEGLAVLPSSAPPASQSCLLPGSAPLGERTGDLPFTGQALPCDLGVRPQGLTVPKLCLHLHTSSSPFFAVQDVAGLLVTHIPHLFPQGDVGREGKEGVPGEAGRRVNGTVVPVLGGGRHGVMLGAHGGLAEGSRFTGGDWLGVFSRLELLVSVYSVVPRASEARRASGPREAPRDPR